MTGRLTDMTTLVHCNNKGGEIPPLLGGENES